MGLMVLPKEPFTSQRKIIDALSVYGFRMGKEMIPHVTISRMKHAVNIQDLQKKWKFTAIKQIADSFVLYQSVLQTCGTNLSSPLFSIERSFSWMREKKR